jgi:hypothetical protein
MQLVKHWRLYDVQGIAKGNAGLIRDQRYRAEPWCRNTDGGLRKLTTERNADAGLTFLRHSDIPAFTCDLSISYSKNNTISSCPWTCKVHHFRTFELPAVWTWMRSSRCGWYLAMCGWDLAKCGWDLAKCGLDLAKCGWDLTKCGWYLAKCEWDLAKYWMRSRQVVDEI